MFCRKRRGLSEADVAAAVKAAVADATLATTLAGHMEACTQNNKRVDEALAKQSADRLAMHTENQARFSKLERVVYIAMGLGMAMSFVVSHAGELFKVWMVR